MSVTSAIGIAYVAYSVSGLDLGAKVGEEQDAGYGGRVQIYQNGRIYWHPEVGAHEVHGGILEKYLELGGPGINPVSHQRDLGFPVSREERTYFHVSPIPVSHFEFGSIFWFPGSGGVLLAHGYRERWIELGEQRGTLGYPLHDSTDFAGGHVIYFERGCMWRSSDGGPIIVGEMSNMPRLGRPLIAENGATVQDLHSSIVQYGIEKTIFDSISASKPELWTSLWNGPVQLRFRAVTRPGDKTEDVTASVETGQAFLWESPSLVVQNLKLSAGGFRDRTLYDFVLQLPDGREVVIAPHALYAKESWEFFGTIHATDLHVSRRADEIAARLHDLGQTEGVERFVNFNDGFRDLILHANALHQDGGLDLLVLTGDLIDYVFEHDDDKLGGGNFAFFERLVRGMDPFPFPNEHKVVEELIVPIFVTLGNHDYRPNSYELVAFVDYTDLATGIVDFAATPFVGYNLTADEVIALSGGVLPEVNAETALKWVEIDGSRDAYRYMTVRIHQLEATNYIVELGPHRLVMLDSAWDLGIPAGEADALLTWLGGSDEDFFTAMSGSPNSRGFTVSQLQLVRDALTNVEEEGIVIVGVHAPPLYPAGSELPHYFREIEHFSSDPNETLGFLRRRDASFAYARSHGSPPETALLTLHPTWSTSRTQYIKWGSVDDLLDYGISKGQTNEFLNICAGDGVPRKVDLVLTGHHHHLSEFRIARNDNTGELYYYMDFYTENPSRYYASKTLGFDQRVHIFVRDGAAFGASPIVVQNTDPEPLWKEWVYLIVPSNPETLSSAANPRLWWGKYRPVILQTACLGPIDENQRRPSSVLNPLNYLTPSAPVVVEKQINKFLPSIPLRGFREITVTENVISRITYRQTASPALAHE